jgi:transcription antitermination factor NusG
MMIARETRGVYPHDVLESTAADTAVEERRWWAVYTRSRQEKAFSQQLIGYQIPHYLPLVDKLTYSRHRRQMCRVPLFSGYVFLLASEQERVKSLTTNRVSRVLPVPDGERLRSDLRQIARLIASGAPLTVEQRLAPGRRVRIRHGPLMGLEGTVVERRSGTRLFVAVDFLQQGASIDLEDFVLEPLD